MSRQLAQLAQLVPYSLLAARSCCSYSSERDRPDATTTTTKMTNDGVNQALPCTTHPSPSTPAPAPHPRDRRKEHAQAPCREQRENTRKNNTPRPGASPLTRGASESACNSCTQFPNDTGNQGWLQLHLTVRLSHKYLQEPKAQNNEKAAPEDILSPPPTPPYFSDDSASFRSLRFSPLPSLHRRFCSSTRSPLGLSRNGTYFRPACISPAPRV